MPASTTVTISVLDVPAVTEQLSNAANLVASMGEQINSATSLLEHVRQDSRVPCELRSKADAWLKEITT